MQNIVHFMLATSISMTIAFVLHCVLHQTRVDNSIIQQYLYDVARDSLLTFRCWFDGRNELLICSDIIYSAQDGNLEVFQVWMLVMMSSLILFGQQLCNLIRPIVQTAMIVWLLARFCEGKHLYYVPDVLTVYWLIWQCTYVMCKWEDHDLSFPLVTLQQGSFCISASLLSFLVFDLVYRFLPTQLIYTILWLLALYDTVNCLHINGRFYNILSTISDKPVLPGYYYPYDFENMAICESDSKYPDIYIDGKLMKYSKNNLDFIGKGDFLVFNLMGLLVVDPLWPTPTKIYLFIGCMISIHMGHFMTETVQNYWKQNIMPGLPLSVITFSTYTVLIHSFMSNPTLESIHPLSCI